MVNNSYKFKQYRKEKTVHEKIGFTWSPDETQYEINDVYILIDNICRDSAYYTFYPEYRDLESKTGLHYHGMLYIFDKCKWFKRSVPFWNKIGKMQPHWQFERLDDYEFRYMLKQNNTCYTNDPSHISITSLS